MSKIPARVNLDEITVKFHHRKDHHDIHFTMLVVNLGGIKELQVNFCNTEREAFTHDIGVMFARLGEAMIRGETEEET